MSSEQYCLKWNDHRNILLSNFERLLENSTSVDCTLAAEGQFLRAHKVVLSACSPYFELLLNQDKEKHPIIFMKDMKFQELKAIMLYMYRGEVVIPHEQLTALLHAAESLQIKGLGCGDKQPTETVKKGLNQQRQMMQQPQMVQQPKQSIRQQPAPRMPESPRESGPQIVDLTEERVPSNVIKRVPSQTTVRYKRTTYSPGTSPYQPQNVTPLATPLATPVANINQINAVRGPLPVQNLPSSSTSPLVAPFSVRPVLPVNRPVHETSIHVSPQATLPKRPELQDKRDPGKQAVILQVNSKASYPLTQKRSIQSELSPGQKSRQSPLPSQSAVAPDADNVSNVSENAEPKRHRANDYVGDGQSGFNPGATPTVAPTAENIRSEVKTRRSAEENSRRDCTVNETVPNKNSSLSDSVSDQAKETEPEKSASGDMNETLSSEDVSLDKPGPSGAGKPGRRRRSGPDRRFSCPECDKKFSQKGNLEKHLRLHDGDAYQCDVCDKMFLTRPALIKHVRSHSVKLATPTQQKCRLCGASFTSAVELETHLTEHTLAAESEGKE